MHGSAKKKRIVM